MIPQWWFLESWKFVILGLESPGECVKLFTFMIPDFNFMHFSLHKSGSLEHIKQFAMLHLMHKHAYAYLCAFADLSCCKNTEFVTVMCRVSLNWLWTCCTAICMITNSDIRQSACSVCTQLCYCFLTFRDTDTPIHTQKLVPELVQVSCIKVLSKFLQVLVQMCTE